MLSIKTLLYTTLFNDWLAVICKKYFLFTLTEEFGLYSVRQNRFYLLSDSQHSLKKVNQHGTSATTFSVFPTYFEVKQT